ncbi:MULTISPECIES: DUF1016 N-terminal domain-containing protein [unclassified Polaribacter]|uniref:DUF1016 N-terminal domain-containing protein n=1 Tax=unclassified Polaribacter TaxID=196858 RepID=UPI0029390766|nr:MULTISPECIES: DUF1016 N-terminal domain-containing protein [unclassified Polaribacter]
MIEYGKQQVVSRVNSILTITYWQIGKKINDYILKNERAEYGGKVVINLAKDLEKQFGRSYTLRNVRRMIQFAEQFDDLQIVTSLMTQLSWTHFLELFPLKTKESKLFYANKIINEKWSVRQTKFQIKRKAFERKEIASL